MRAVLIVNPKATATTRSRPRRPGPRPRQRPQARRRRDHPPRPRRRDRRRGRPRRARPGGHPRRRRHRQRGDQRTDDRRGPAPPGLRRRCPAARPTSSAAGSVCRPTRSRPPAPCSSRCAPAAAGSISLGPVNGRYFSFCAGIGFDAEVTGVVEGRRRDGARSTPGLYVRSAVRHFYDGSRPGRRSPPRSRARRRLDGLQMVVVSNTSPWTYWGSRPLRPSPEASFDTGLDLFAMRKMRLLPTLRALGQMAAAEAERTARPQRSPGATTCRRFVLTARRPGRARGRRRLRRASSTGSSCASVPRRPDRHLLTLPLPAPPVRDRIVT